MATYSQQRNTQRRNTCDHVQATWKHPPVITYNQRWNNCDHVQKETLVATHNQQWNTCDYMKINRGTHVATYSQQRNTCGHVQKETLVATHNQQWNTCDYIQSTKKGKTRTSLSHATSDRFQPMVNVQKGKPSSTKYSLRRHIK